MHKDQQHVHTDTGLKIGAHPLIECKQYKELYWSFQFMLNSKKIPLVYTKRVLHYSVHIKRGPVNLMTLMCNNVFQM